MCYHNLRNTKVERGETMFTVHVNKLNGKIHERGFNKSSFSKELGIDRNTLSGYLNNPKKIPYDVIDKMASIASFDFPCAFKAAAFVYPSITP